MLRPERPDVLTSPCPYRCATAWRHPPMDVMGAIGMEVDPFMEPWVEAWNAWDDQRNHDG